MQTDDSWVRPAKIGLAIVWAISVACLLSPASFPAALATIGKWVFWIMLGAHVVELFAIWMPWTKKAPGSPAAHVLQVLIFGVIHGQAMKAAVERASAGTAARNQ
jgi:uncharacterized protein YhhL (DUF1145 family)